MTKLIKIIEEYRIRNFTVAEVLVRNKEEDILSGLIENIIPTLVMLQEIRDYVNVPIIINSSYRSPEYNKRIGGASNSLHLKFNAIDFSPTGFKRADYDELLYRINARYFNRVIKFKGKETLISPAVMGIGLYPNFMHIDTRGLIGLKAPSRWDLR